MRQHRAPLNRQLFSAITICVAILTTHASGQAKSARTDYQHLVKQLRADIQHELTERDLPAFSIALVDGQKMVWAEGFGYVDKDRKQHADALTVYRVGSVSKLFTDLATMQLVEREELSLDAPITRYVPEFAAKNPFDVPVTLRQVMSHRAGLVREPPIGHYFDPDEPSLRDTVLSLNRTQLVYKPDSKTKYSNAGIAVVGYALEKKKGLSYSKQIEQRILEPLEMKSSSFELRPAITKKLATAWMWTYDGRRFEAPGFALGTAPAGNMYSTVEDMSKFMATVMNDGRGPRGPILKPKTLKLMTNPPKTKAGQPQRFAIGFHVEKLDGHRKIGHGGAVYGFSTQLEMLPDKKLGVVAVMALDGSNGIVGRIVDHALRLMLARRAGRPLPKWKRTGKVSPQRARQVVGSYRSGKSRIALTERAGRLFLRRGSYRYELRSTGGGELVVDDVLSFGARVKPIENGKLTLDDRKFKPVKDVPPKRIPDRWRGLIGEYGWDHNTLYILESHGEMYALIEWFYYYPLKEVSPNEFAFPDFGLYHGERLKFARDKSGVATQVNAAEVVFKRRAVGTRDGETFRITPVRPIAELRAAALKAKPPREPGEFRKPQLVELNKLDSSIKLDIRYASRNNFTGAAFYRQSRAFMQKPAAEAVVRAHRRLKKRGLGLLIHDAYRPWHVTKMFWDATPKEMKAFVANPANGSRHNRGCAVDLTLYDLKSGKPIQMVAGYDEFSPRSFPAYPGGTSRQRWYRELLRRTMEAEGFSVYEFEWWHFDFRDWKKYRIGNSTFEQILGARVDRRKQR